MIDYNSLSYQEGRALLKRADLRSIGQAISTGVQNAGSYLGDKLAPVGQAISTGAQNAGSYLGDKLGPVGQQIGDAWKGLDPMAQNSLIGAGVGGLAGVGSSLFQDEDERSPVSRGLLGALLGGAGGAGYTMATAGGKGPEDFKKEIMGQRAKAEQTANIAAGGKPGKALLPFTSQADKAFHDHNPDGTVQTTLDNPTGTNIPKGLAETVWDATGATPSKIITDTVNGQGPNVRDLALVGAQGVGAGIGSQAGGTGAVNRAAERMLHGKAQTPAQALERGGGMFGPDQRFGPGAHDAPNASATHLKSVRDAILNEGRKAHPDIPKGPPTIVPDPNGAILKPGTPALPPSKYYGIRTPQQALDFIGKEHPVGTLLKSLTDPARANPAAPGTMFEGGHKNLPTKDELNVFGGTKEINKLPMNAEGQYSRVGRWWNPETWRSSGNRRTPAHLGRKSSIGGAILGLALPLVTDRAISQFTGGTTIADAAQKALAQQLAQAAMSTKP